MRFNFQFIFVVALASATLVGCNNAVNFASKKKKESNLEVVISPPPITPTNPEEPVPVEPPPVVVEPEEPQPAPVLNLKSGTCPVDKPEALLSCLDCQSSPDIPAPPLLSRKAQELLNIMTVACSIHNKSDPAGYIAPRYEQLLKRVIQCSPAAYQDTAFVNTQAGTINALLNNAQAQTSAFSGLYYNWASTDFETYFGLDIGEARYTFCRGQASFNSGGVYPKEYYDSLYSGIPYTLPPVYKKAQVIRGQLRNCLAESLRNPDRDPLPPTPGKKCAYESAEGEMSPLVVDKANDWISKGQKVYFEGFNMCGEMDFPESFLDNKGPIKIVTKVCL